MVTNKYLGLLNVPVKDIMVSPVLFVEAEWRISDAASFFLEHKISGAPVIDEKGDIVGVLTLKDISHYAMWHLEVEEYEDDFRDVDALKEKKNNGELTVEYRVDKFASTTVRQVMTRKLISLGENSSLRDVVCTMIKKGIHRVFVKNYSGKVVGVVTTMDVVRWLEQLDPKIK